MSTRVLRVFVADDERPPRRFLIGLLKACPGVEVVGEAASGDEALELIATTSPDLALLDLHMPELGGLELVRRLPLDRRPLIAFVTAFDEFAIEAFELNAIDYVLKPAERARVAATIERARDRLRQQGPWQAQANALAQAAAVYEQGARRGYLDRIPVKHRDEVVLLPVRHVASIVAEGELLHLTTVSNNRYTISHRLHALEARLDPRRFIRLGRGAIANLDAVTRVSAMPGGTYTVTLSNGQQLAVSRIQSRVLRETLLTL